MLASITKSFGADLLRLSFVGFMLAAVTFSHGETRWLGIGSKTIIGSGTLVTVPRDIGKFDRLEISDGIRATLRQSGVQKVVVTADDNVAPLVEMQLNATTLRVRIKPNTNLRTKNPVAIAIDFTALDQLQVMDGVRAELDVAKATRFVAKATDGADLQIADIESSDVEIVVADGANVRVTNVRKAEQLNYRLRDGARLTVDTSNGAQTKLNIEDGASFTSRGINASMLEVKMSDGANAKLSGNAIEQRFTLNDGASLDARDLRGDNAIAKVVDASSLELGALKKLDLQVQDGGSIRYTGEPAIHALKSDGGSIRKY
jgi:Putative auto-transporter adhesin, head GIN domain